MSFNEWESNVFEPEGAFYIFPSIKKFGMTSEEFATKLLNEEKVAIVPGSAFGACGEGYLRVSYAYSIEELKRSFRASGTIYQSSSKEAIDKKLRDWRVNNASHSIT